MYEHTWGSNEITSMKMLCRYSPCIYNPRRWNSGRWDYRVQLHYEKKAGKLRGLTLLVSVPSLSSNRNQSDFNNPSLTSSSVPLFLLSPQGLPDYTEESKYNGMGLNDLTPGLSPFFQMSVTKLPHSSRIPISQQTTPKWHLCSARPKYWVFNGVALFCVSYRVEMNKDLKFSISMVVLIRTNESCSFLGWFAGLDLNYKHLLSKTSALLTH